MIDKAGNDSIFVRILISVHVAEYILPKIRNY